MKLKAFLIILALLVLLFTTAFLDFQRARVTVIGTLSCGATWCEESPGDWVHYWIDTPGCAAGTRLFIYSDDLPGDCSMKGQVITARGYITRGSSGCWVLKTQKLRDCFPTPGVPDCQDK